MKDDGRNIIMGIIIHDETEEVLARMSGRSPNLDHILLYDFAEAFPDISNCFLFTEREKQKVRGWWSRREAHSKRQGKAIRVFIKEHRREDGRTSN